MAVGSETGMGFSTFILFSGVSLKELVRLADLTRTAFLASSAAKVERTDVIICWE